MSGKDIEFVVFNDNALRKSWFWLNNYEIKYLTVTLNFDLAQ